MIMLGPEAAGRKRRGSWNPQSNDGYRRQLLDKNGGFYFGLGVPEAILKSRISAQSSLFEPIQEVLKGWVSETGQGREAKAVCTDVRWPLSHKWLSLHRDIGDDEEHGLEVVPTQGRWGCLLTNSHTTVRLSTVQHLRPALNIE